MTEADAPDVVFSSVELGIDAFVMLSDTPYSCTRRVLVRWCVLTAGEDGALQRNSRRAALFWPRSLHIPAAQRRVYVWRGPA